MRREDATPYDGPACPRCGAEVEEHETLCEDCLELAAERLERRRAARELVGSERAACP